MAVRTRDASVAGAPAVVGRPVAGGGLISRITSSDSLIGRLADLLTLLGILLAPSYGLAIGGRLGFAFADLVLGLAAGARGLHLLMRGVPLAGIRRQSFLIGLLFVFSGSAVVSSVVNGQAIPLILITVVVATLGSVLLVATFGSGGGEERERDLLRLVQVYAIGNIILAASCYLGPVSREGRAIGYAIHPNALGHSCVMGVAACVWLWDRASTTRWRLIWAGGALLNVGALMQSGSRGGVVGLGVGMIVYLCLRGNLRLRLAAIAGGWLIVLVLVAGVVQLPAGNPIQRLFVGGANTEGSNEARRELLEEDIENIGEAPVFGKGYKTVVDVHNVYFQGWIGGGALDAFILMIIGTTMLLLPLWQRPRDLALACGATAIAIAWLFTNIMTARDQWIFIALTFATARSPSVLKPRDEGATRA